MKEELESHQEKGEEGLDWVKPDVTLLLSSGRMGLAPELGITNTIGGFI
jgi:hypothetical protein